MGADDTADDPVVDARPIVLKGGERIELFDATTATEGFVDNEGDLLLLRGEKYIASDGAVYTCDDSFCYILWETGGDGYTSHNRRVNYDLS